MDRKTSTQIDRLISNGYSVLVTPKTKPKGIAKIKIDEKGRILPLTQPNGKGKRWSPDEVYALQMFRHMKRTDKQTLAQFAQRRGRGYNSVTAKMSNLGGGFGHLGRFDKEVRRVYKNNKPDFLRIARKAVNALRLGDLLAR